MKRLIAVATDRLTLRNATRLAAEMELDLVAAATPGQITETPSPVAVIIDLELHEDMDVVKQCKRLWPLAMVVGVVTMPGGDVWQRAEQEGCDLVTTRGALSKVVPTKLTAWMQAPGGRRLRLFALGDVAGRLGVLERWCDPEFGPLAVYRVGAEFRVAQDSCPHAGARLSLGEWNADEGVITCPEHGSRFDVKDGHRVRGPADVGLQTFLVTIEDGQVYVQLNSPLS